MSKVSQFSNKFKTYAEHNFGTAEGILRVLAKKMPDADLSDAAITFKMNVIANKFNQAGLIQKNLDEPEDVENLIELMQIAEYLTILANKQKEIKQILCLAEKVQSAENRNLDIVDVMILLSKCDYKDVVNSFNVMSLKDVQAL